MSNPTRAPAGTPEGGRFAPGQHGEPGVTLASNQPSDPESLVDQLAIGETPERDDLRHQLALAHREAEQARGRVTLLCARLLADEVTTAYPEATHIRVHRNGYETLPAAIESILDENGGELATVNPAGQRLDDGTWQLLFRWDHDYVEHLDLDGATRGRFLTGERPQPKAYGDYVDVLDIGKAQHIVADNSTRNGSS